MITLTLRRDHNDDPEIVTFDPFPPAASAAPLFAELVQQEITPGRRSGFNRASWQRPRIYDLRDLAAAQGWLAKISDPDTKEPPLLRGDPFDFPARLIGVDQSVPGVGDGRNAQIVIPLPPSIEAKILHLGGKPTTQDPKIILATSPDLVPFLPQARKELEALRRFQIQITPEGVTSAELSRLAHIIHGDPTGRVEYDKIKGIYNTTARRLFVRYIPIPFSLELAK